MVHRHHSDLVAFEWEETPLDNPKATLAEGSVFKNDGVVIGFNNSFAVVPFGLGEGISI